MASTNINIRMDSDLKMQFEAFCADMGMTMTAAINILRRRRCVNIAFLLRLAAKCRML